MSKIRNTEKTSNPLIIALLTDKCATQKLKNVRIILVYENFASQYHNIKFSLHTYVAYAQTFLYICIGHLSNSECEWCEVKNPIRLVNCVIVISQRINNWLA